MTTPNTDPIAIACEYYRAGRLAEAEALYRRVLEREPEQVQVLFWLATIANQLSKPEESMAYYQRILELKPNDATAHSNLGSVLGHQGRIAEAIAHHRQALALMPSNADAHYNLAVALYQAGQVEEAALHYRRATELNPDHASAHANLGLALYGQGNLEEAVIHYQKAIALKPDHINAHNGLAVVLYHLGRLDEATFHCQQAIAFNPNYFSAYNNLGTIFQKQGRLDEAMVQYQRAISLNPNYANAYDNLGTIYQERKNLETAIAHYRKAITLDPRSANAHNNLGSALKAQGRLEEAIACCREAIRLQPNHADAHNNLGSSLVEQAQFEEAIAHYEQAIRYKPDHVNAHLNLGIVLLMLGEFRRGFAEYHWRWHSNQCPPLRYPRAFWDGSDLKGKIILLTAEQGFGDTIQFARYAPLVAQRGGCVVVACQKPLVRLLETLAGINRCVDRDRVNVETHFHAPLLDLPFILGTTLETIPANVPYLTPPPSQVQLPPPAQPESIAPAGSSPSFSTSLKIGIVWASNPDNATSQKRTCPLAYFLSLAQIPGVTLYSLQKDLSESDAALLEANPILLDLRHQLNDFGDTAAAIAQLDLIISVDTAVAHLAGALGKSVWTLLPYVADWRWLLHREDSPWYPTMRLFRQKREGDWEEVFRRVGKALRQKVAEAREGGKSERQDSEKMERPMLEGSSTAIQSAELVNRLSSNPLSIFKKCRHGLLLYYPSTPMGKALELYGEWLEGEVDLFRSLLRPGDTVVEVGAAIGAHTLIFARLVGEAGKVVAIAPQRLLFQALCANLAINGIAHTHCYQAILGDTLGWIPVTFSGVDLPGQPDPCVGEKIPMITLDQLELAQCRLLKIGVEEVTLRALQRASTTIQQHQPVLYFESLHQEVSPDLIFTLNSLGYDLYWHHPPLYNPKNFFHNPENIFGAAKAFNILGFHRDQNIRVEGMNRVIPGNGLSRSTRDPGISIK
ncbi:FkbM family methyltransferase [Leptothermofonsia sp. ETS-13]|uniref:FkbM family methyltransferase n=1 Tax=Leptothermofonsia sp. ETS-13 TaxID=3035696 RepID=UPI003B9F355D